MNRSFLKIWFVVAAVIFSGLFFTIQNVAHAATNFNQQINYQGRLMTTSNVAVPSGSYGVRFKLYTVPTGGAAIWSEVDCYSPDNGVTCNGTGTDRRVSLTNGVFSALLGSTTPLTGVDFNQTLYLGVEIGGLNASSTWDGEMTPRKKLGAVPAAMYAGTSTVATTLNGVSDTQFVRNDQQNATSSAGTFLNILQSGAGKVAEFFGQAAQSILSILSNGNVGIGSSTPTATLSVTGTSSAGVNPFVVASSSNAQMLTLLRNGNFGIGTSSPNQTLSVAGNFNLTGAIYDSLYNPGTNGMILQTTGSATKWVATSTLGLGGTNYLTNSGVNTFLNLGTNLQAPTFNATSTTQSSIFPQASTTNLTVSNKLGINTNSPEQPLHVKGALMIEGNPTPRLYFKSNDGNWFVINRYTGQSSYTGYFGENADTGGLYFRGQGAFYFGDQTTPAIFAQGSTKRVGIGGVTSPDYTLDVAGTFGVKIAGGSTTDSPGSDSFTTTYSNVTPNSVSGDYGGFSFTFYDDGSGNLLDNGDDHQIGTINYSNGAVETGSYFSDTIDSITYSYTGATTLATLSDGKVGIGTDAPTTALTINHAANETTTFLNTAIGDVSTMSFGYNGTSGQVVWNARPDFSLIIQDSATGNGKLGVHLNAASVSPLSNLDVGGNVAIGSYAGVTAAPTNGFIVSGNVGIGSSSPVTALGVTGTTTTTNLRLTGALADGVNSAGTNGMVLQTTGAGVRWVATSSLGISGGAGTNYFTNSGTNTYLNLGTNLQAPTFNATSTTGTSTFANAATFGGRVGIGTASPSYPLDVLGFINVDGTSGYKQNGETVLVSSSSKSSVFLGGSAGAQLVNSTGFWNTAIGYNTLGAATSSVENTAIGFNSLANTTADFNTAIGTWSMYANSTGFNNTALGGYTLRSNTTGTSSAAGGTSALYANTTGSYNTGFGMSALRFNSTGSNNTALGFRSLYNVLGSNNVGIGYSAGKYETGSDSFYVDNQDRVNTAGDKAGALLYGKFNATAASQTLVINASTTVAQNLSVLGVGSSYFAGNVGIGSSSPVSALGVTGTTTTTGLSVGSLNGLLFGTNGNIATIATSSLGLQTALTGGVVGSLTYWTGAGTVGATSSPVVGYLTATSVATSTFAGSVAIGNAGVLAVPTANAFAVGVAGSGGSITSSGLGAIAFGQAIKGSSGGTITASGAGALAGGVAIPGSAAGNITASGAGSVALGDAPSGGTITSSGLGSFALGYATGSDVLQATGTASFAMGQNVQALANNAFAFGSNFINSTASTFKVGFASNPALTVNATSVGIGSSTPSATLSVTGVSTAGVNPFVVASSSSAQMLTLLQNGNFGVGSSTPVTALGVVGTTTTTNLRLTGAFADSFNSAGTNGMVLLSTGSATQWVATSSLGISGGAGTNYLSNSGANTFLNLGTNLQAPTFNATSTTGTSTFANAATFGGRVGVGTTTPAYSLDVNGSIRAAGTGKYIVHDITNTTGDFGSIYGTYGGGSPAMIFHVGTDQDFAIQPHISFSSGISFAGVNDSNTVNTPIEFRASAFDFTQGNVGINTASAGSNLSVVGNGITTSREGAFKVDNGALVNFPQTAIAGLYGTPLVGIGGSGDTAFYTDLGSNQAAVFLSSYDEGTDRMIGVASPDAAATNYFAGNTGIGNNSPGHLLDIGSNAFIAADGSASLANGGFTVDASGNTYNAGKLGVGSSSPVTALGVVGTTTTTNLRLTGAFADSFNLPGTNGMVLQSTGSATKWIATSSLGLQTALNGGTNGWLTYWTGAGTIGATSSPVVGYLTATSTIATSTFPNASTTNFRVNGNLVDSLGNTGTLGMVLQTTGSAVKWVATSSLGFAASTTLANLTSGLTAGTAPVWTGTKFADSALQIDQGGIGAVGTMNGNFNVIGTPVGGSSLGLGNALDSNIWGMINNSNDTYIAGYNLSLDQYVYGNALYVDGNNTRLGVGSTTPGTSLAVVGTSTLDSVRLLGAFNDSFNVPGTNGMVLQSTGSATRWVATSSLGISGGAGTNYLTNSGANTYLNLGTNLQAPTFQGTSTTATSTFPNASTTNLRINGNLVDSLGNTGTLGMVLQTTGSAVKWVATSSLGITGGAGTNYLSNSGANTFLNLGTNLQAPTFNATSTTGTSTFVNAATFGGNVGVGTTTSNKLFAVGNNIYMQADGSAAFANEAFKISNTGGIITSGDLTFTMNTGGWGMNNGGVFRPALDAAQDIGDSSHRVRNLYLSGTLYSTLASTTNLTVAGTATLSGISGLTQCLRVNSSGVVSGTGSDCASGGASSVGSAGWIQFASSTAGSFMANSLFAINTTSYQLTANSFNAASTTATSTFLGNVVIGSSTAASAFVVDTTGNVGIGSSTPGALLSVAGNGFFNGSVTSGNLTATGTLSVSGATSSIATALTIGTTNPNVFQVAPLIVTTNVNGYGQALIQNLNSGNSASADIIIGADRMNDSAYYADLGCNSSGYNQVAYSGTAANDCYLYSSDSNLAIGAASSTGPSSIKFFTAGMQTANQRMIITNTGNVGVGTSTPNAVFAIAGTSGSTNQLIDVASSSGKSYLHVTSAGNVGIGTTTPTALLTIMGTSGSTAQLFDIASSSGASYFHVTSAGNIGIGTSTPLATLHLFNTNTAGASPSMIMGGNPGGDTDFWMARVNDNDTISDDSLQFGGGLAPGTSPYFTIDYTGNVGVGTTSPSQLFTVAGTIGASNLSFLNSTSTVTLQGTGATTTFAALTFYNSSSTPQNIFDIKVLPTNFGGLVSSGAFNARNSYFGEEFNKNLADTAALTTNAGGKQLRGDNSELTYGVKVSTTAANCTFQMLASSANGFERLKALGTASQNAACIEILGTAAGTTTANAIFTTTNLPVITIKAQTSITDSNHRLFLGISDQVTATSTMPNNGVFFSNCQDANCTTGGFANWVGVVKNGTSVSTTTSCGAITVNKFAYLRIEVRGTNDIHFFVDTDTSNGTTETECGTGITLASNTAAESIFLDAYSNTATATQLDVDYFRVWQDDNVSLEDTSELAVPLLTATTTTATTTPLDSDSGLTALMKLLPVTFLYTNDPSSADNQIGFIPEDVQKVDPRLVTFDENGLVSGVRYDRLTAVLAKSIQEQQVQILALQNATTTIDYTLISSTTAVTLASSTSFIVTIAQAVKDLISSTGDWVVNQFTATLAIFDRVQTQTAAVSNGLEMTDAATGQVYCVRISNGDWQKLLGACASPAVTSAPITGSSTVTTPVTTQVAPATSTSTTSTSTASSTASTSVTTITTTSLGGNGDQTISTTSTSTPTAPSVVPDTTASSTPPPEPISSTPPPDTTTATPSADNAPAPAPTSSDSSN